MADKPLLTGVDAKEQIENKTNDRNEPDDQRPCHRLRWLAVVHHHMDDGQRSDDVIDGGQYEVQFVHTI